MQSVLSLALALLLSVSLLPGCESSTANSGAEPQQAAVEQTQQAETQEADSQVQGSGEPEPASADAIDLASVPAYSGSPYVELYGNKPRFTDGDKARGSFEEYSPIDSLGRCGVAFALIGTETMPTEERGSIGSVNLNLPHFR